MPEGPEIRRAADEIEKVLRDEALQSTYFAFEHLKHYEAALTSQGVSRVETRGKAILIRFQGELNVYTHNQLYGRWVVCQSGKIPESKRQLRLAFHTAKKSALLYSASDIEVLKDDELEQHVFLSRLGPDVLTCNLEQVLEQLISGRFQGRQLKSLYLDQHFLAGVGNYLRSEILFEAGLNPARRPLDCSESQLALLAKKSLEIPQRSYRLQGITCDPSLSRQLKREGQQYRQYRHWVFSRAGQPCRKCQTAIVKETANRRYYYCPSCQAA